jgi:hypothetical protein
VTRTRQRRWRSAMRCLPAAIFAAAWTAAAVPSFAQFSPGPLSRAHQVLDGTLSCTKCHELGVSQRPIDGRCLDCHKALKTRIDSGAGYHASQGRNKGCATCHSEHKGRDHDLVGLDRANFDHSQTGLPLAGKHAGLACEKCHREPHGFLGLNRACSSCHEDPHKGQFGIDCARCHEETAWKPAAGFDHGKARYPLTGAHQSVSCSKCHTGGRYKDLKFNDCGDCHDSPHTDAFQSGRACSSCHATVSWGEGASVGFNHAKTRFPLDGAHQRAACSACHRGGRYRTLSGATCETCHKDPHQGQFKQEGRVCTDCHDTSAWRPAPQFDHALTRYPLTGGHTRAACAKCHPDGRYVGTATACSGAGCHQDPHRGEMGSDCGRCHTQVAWSETLFQHGGTKFPLTGNHTRTACGRCHGTGGTARFVHLDPACGACHADPHHGQFRNRYPEPPSDSERVPSLPATPADSLAFAASAGSDSGGGRTGCASCHTPAGWIPSTYDHQKSAFLLTGKHAGVACARCHKEGVFADTAKECSACHSDPHGGQFAGLPCAECHSPAAWDEARFDHRGTLFVLTGRHAKLPCAACHAGGRFRGLSPRCADCHEDAHLQALGADCGRCHTPESWVPSTFEHGIDLFPQWGAHQAVDCASCHRDEVTWQVDAPPRECIDCHDRDFRRAPVTVHMQAGPDCERCHGFDEWHGAHDDAWFNIRTGAHRSVACTRCHDLAPDYADYTCDACHHGHDDGRRRCLECHPHGFGD